MHEVASWLEFQFDQIMLFPRVTKGFLARNGSPQCCIGCLAPIFGRHCAIQERATFQSRDNWWKMLSSSGLNFLKQTAGDVLIALPWNQLQKKAAPQGERSSPGGPWGPL